MKEYTETLQMPAGKMDVFVVRPDGPGPFPVTVQLMDALGMREQLREQARRTAAAGYYVMAPNLFYHLGRSEPFDLSKPDAMTEIFEAMAQVTPARATSDIETCLKFAERDPAARKGPIGL